MQVHGVVASEDQVAPVFEDLTYKERLTIYEPPQRLPIANQYLQKEIKLSKMLKSKGSCKVSFILNKDLFLPREDIVLRATFDNSSCQLGIEKYIVKLQRRVQVFKAKAKDVLFVKDDFTHVEEYEAQCPKGHVEEREFTVYVPEKL